MYRSIVLFSGFKAFGRRKYMIFYAQEQQNAFNGFKKKKKY